MRYRSGWLTIVSTTIAALAAGCNGTGPQAGKCTRCGMVAAALDTELPIIADGAVGRAITWENRTGEPGAGGKAGEGRKGSPCIRNFKNGDTATLMDIAGCGVIRHIWITIPDRSPAALRNMILRMYWDNSPVPSVEAPLGDFMGIAHGRCKPLSTAYTSMPRGRGFNCYFPMPFATHARITVTNDLPEGRDMRAFFFQIDYELRDRLPPNTGRFHAQFRRQNPTVKKQDYVLLDNVEGPGMFIGCVIGVRALGPHWWGEGEMKFYMDGDTDYPTICGTGTEDYFLAGWGMGEFETPSAGCPVCMTNEFFKHPLVSMYRFHGKDPVYFRKSFKAVMQQLGAHRGLFERSDDWCSVAYWYQLEPVKQMPPLPDRQARTADVIEPPEPRTDREGFLSLFDGRTLEGWVALTSEGREVSPAESAFSVQEGMIYCSGKGKDYWLARKEKYADFVLRLDYKVAEGTNSGVFLRAPDYERPAFKGFEVQILDDAGKPPTTWTSPAIFDVITPLQNASRPAGEWNFMEITCRGLLVSVCLNGQKVIDADFSLLTEPVGKFDFPYARMPKAGLIGVQNHGGALWFRNIRIKKLST